MTTPTRAETVAELRKAGWPSVADDLVDGLSTQAVLRRLRDIGEEGSTAYEIVAATDLNDASDPRT